MHAGVLSINTSSQFNSTNETHWTSCDMILSPRLTTVVVKNQTRRRPCPHPTLYLAALRLNVVNDCAAVLSYD
jgi:hypothetical protein